MRVKCVDCYWQKIPVVVWARYSPQLPPKKPIKPLNKTRNTTTKAVKGRISPSNCPFYHLIYLVLFTQHLLQPLSYNIVPKVKKFLFHIPNRSNLIFFNMKLPTFNKIYFRMPNTYVEAVHKIRHQSRGRGVCQKMILLNKLI